MHILANVLTAIPLLPSGSWTDSSFTISFSLIQMILQITIYIFYVKEGLLHWLCYPGNRAFQHSILIIRPGARQSLGPRCWNWENETQSIKMYVEIILQMKPLQSERALLYCCVLLVVHVLPQVFQQLFNSLWNAIEACTSIYIPTLPSI